PSIRLPRARATQFAAVSTSDRTGNDSRACRDSYRRDCALLAYACPAASRRSGAEVEIIGELDAGLRLACTNARTETAPQPRFLAQGPYRCSVKWGFLQYHFQMRRMAACAATVDKIGRL